MGSPITNEVSLPWLTPEGRLYSDEILRNISKSWTPEVWEQFLENTVDRPLRELPLTPQELDRFEEARIREFWEIVADANHQGPVAGLVRRIIRDRLTAKQQQLIRLLFWEGFSERRAAEFIGLSNGTVHGLKIDILNKLKKLLERHPSVCATSRKPHQQGVQTDETSAEMSCDSIRSDLC